MTFTTYNFSSPPSLIPRKRAPTQTPAGMNQDTRDKPDEATAGSDQPPHDERAFEAHKESMLEMLRNNTAYMDSVMRLHRRADPEADASSKPPDFFFYGSSWTLM